MIIFCGMPQPLGSECSEMILSLQNKRKLSDSGWERRRDRNREEAGSGISTVALALKARIKGSLSQMENRIQNNRGKFYKHYHELE